MAPYDCDRWDVCTATVNLRAAILAGRYAKRALSSPVTTFLGRKVCKASAIYPCDGRRLAGGCTQVRAPTRGGRGFESDGVSHTSGTPHQRHYSSRPPCSDSSRRCSAKLSKERRGLVTLPGLHSRYGDNLPLRGTIVKGTKYCW